MGILYVVATPIGNLHDISERALDTLNSVDLIACEDTRTSSVLLDHFKINKKLVSYHKFNEKSKSLVIIDDLLNGKNVALISDAGCPCISDPGVILVNEAVKHQIEVIGIPGACAFIDALMVSGMDTTSFTFYGFLERENKKIVEELELIKKDSSKLAIIYESPKRVSNLLKKIDEIFNNPNVCLCNDLTKKFERKYYGETKKILKELEENKNSELGEYVLIIEKNNNNVETKEDVSIESLIIDEIIKNNCTMKDAIKIVSDKYRYPKNAVYNASLNLKKYLNKL